MHQIGYDNVKISHSNQAAINKNFGTLFSSFILTHKHKISLYISLRGTKAPSGPAPPHYRSL
jgi:hypothetical protein